MDFELTNYMEEALHTAELSARRGEVPVGAVVVDNKTGRIVAKTGNQMIGRFDPTAHAEMLAIRAAAGMVGSQRLVDCDMYVTLEPCQCVLRQSHLHVSVACILGLLIPKEAVWSMVPEFLTNQHVIINLKFMVALVRHKQVDC